MVFDGGQIVGAMLAIVCIVVFIVILINVIRIPSGELGVFMILFIIFVAIATLGAYTIVSAAARGNDLAIVRDLEGQGFCVVGSDSMSNPDTATICKDDGSVWRVDVIKQGGHWIAIANTQKQIKAPETPLRPDDLNTTTTSQPLR